MSRSLLIMGAVYLLFAVPLSFINSRRFRISLPLVLIGSAALLLCRFVVLGQPPAVCRNLAFALGSSLLIFFCVRVLSGDGLGWGDVFFGMFSALYTGFYMNIVAVVFAALLGMLYYLMLAAVQRLRKKTHIHRPIFAIPFAPFICAGSVLCVLLFYVIA